jgi:Ankyrin repeats (many copies)
MTAPGRSRKRGEPKEKRPAAAAGKAGAAAGRDDDLPWLDDAENRWGVPVVDLRKIVPGLTSVSEDPRMAANLASFANDDGTSFANDSPAIARTVDCALRYPIDCALADGALFVPRAMEDKWALYVHSGQLLCVRSWQRKLLVAADIRTEGGEAVVGPLHGAFLQEAEAGVLSVRMLDFLVRTHALSEIHPAPLAARPTDLRKVVAECFAMWGSRGLLASYPKVHHTPPSRPLRTYSLLHMAVARGDRQAVARHLAAGVPMDLLAADGLSPAHWALGSRNSGMLEWLFEQGCPVDVRSAAGATPLMQAVQAGRLDAVSALLERGADPNACDARGFTALHRAAEMGSARIVERLLARGGDPDVVAQGETARQLAEQRGHAAVLALLPG